MKCYNKNVLESEQNLKGAVTHLNYCEREQKEYLKGNWIKEEWILNLHEEMRQKAEHDKNKAFETLQNTLKEITEKEKVLLIFESTLKETLPNQKLIHFLRENIKKRYNSDDMPFFASGTNYQQIEHLFKNGYKAVIDKFNHKVAEKQDNSYFKVKISEWVYLKYLESV